VTDLSFSETKLAEAGAVRREPESAPAPPRRAVDRAVLIQFVQFCLVGALSTALNEALFNLFWAVGLSRDWSFVLAFSLAVTNGFFLNRAWTFRRFRAHKMQRQYVMFFVVNLVGLGLSWVVMSLVGGWLLRIDWAAALAPQIQRLIHRPVAPERLAYSMGLLVATLPCAVWNFSANKLWTFQGTQGDGM
jgi:putative flippase GtrA